MARGTLNSGLLATKNPAVTYQKKWPRRLTTFIKHTRQMGMERSATFANYIGMFLRLRDTLQRAKLRLRERLRRTKECCSLIDTNTGSTMVPYSMVSGKISLPLF